MNNITDIERFYNASAEKYFTQTINVSMEASLQRFAETLEPGGLVVDAGCGSGRDSRWFLDNGFSCYSYDAAEDLAARAQRYLGAPLQVHCHRHDALALSEPADGIWASASLLFLNDDDLATALQTFHRNLKPGGVLFTSFKHGSGWRQDGERRFRDLRPEDAGLLEQLSGLKLLRVHSDEDAQGRGNQWNGFLLRKES